METVVDLPDSFIGEFLLEKSENFDEYLVARGLMNWMIRKIVKLGSLTKIFSTNSEDAQYKLINKFAGKTIEYNFDLNSEIEAMGFDKKQHMLTWTVENGVLYEKHIIDGKTEEPEIYTYERIGEHLVMTMKAGDVTCKRFLKKLEK